VSQACSEPSVDFGSEISGNSTFTAVMRSPLTMFTLINGQHYVDDPLELFLQVYMNLLVLSYMIVIELGSWNLTLQIKVM